MGKIAYDDLLASSMAWRIVIDFDDIEIKSVIGRQASFNVFRGIYRPKGGRGQDEKVK